MVAFQWIGASERILVRQDHAQSMERIQEQRMEGCGSTPGTMCLLLIRSEVMVDQGINNAWGFKTEGEVGRASCVRDGKEADATRSD